MPISPVYVPAPGATTQLTGAEKVLAALGPPISPDRSPTRGSRVRCRGRTNRGNSRHVSEKNARHVPAAEPTRKAPPVLTGFGGSRRVLRDIRDRNGVLASTPKRAGKSRSCLPRRERQQGLVSYVDSVAGPPTGFAPGPYRPNLARIVTMGAGITHCGGRIFL